MDDAQELQNIENMENTQATPPPSSEPSVEEVRIAELEAELAHARQEATKNWNKFLRERADIENMRKRQERLLLERVQQQKKALLHKFLGVLDNVDRAL